MIRFHGVRLHLIVMLMIVSFASVVMIAPAAEARTDYAHKPDHKPRTDFTHEPDPVPESQYDRGEDMTVVHTALEREKVREKLQSLGFSVEGIKERLERLDDEQIHRMAQRIEHVKAGGHLGLGELNVVLLIIVIILSPLLAIIWLILTLMGHEPHLHEESH